MKKIILSKNKFKELIQIKGEMLGVIKTLFSFKVVFKEIQEEFIDNETLFLNRLGNRFRSTSIQKIKIIYSGSWLRKLYCKLFCKYVDSKNIRGFLIVYDSWYETKDL